MKKIVRSILLVLLLLFVACGSKQPDKTDERSTKSTNKKQCQRNCQISLDVHKEKLNNNETFEYTADDFQIRSVEYIMKSDSLADIRLSNYPKDSLSSPIKGSRIDICISLRSQKGKKLQPGNYAYMDFEAGFFAKVNIVTSKGTIWFNWISGMPAQGSVEVFQIDDGSVCGEVNLSVDKADNASIGVVKLNGNFFAEAK